METISSVSMRMRSSSVRPTPRMRLSLSLRIAPWAAQRSARQLVRALECLSRRDNLVDQPNREGFGAVDPPAGDDQLHGPGKAHHQWKTNRHPISCDDVPSPLESAELRRFIGNADIGEQDGFQPRSECVAVDGGDHGLIDAELPRVATEAGQVVKVATKCVPVTQLLHLARVLQIPAR